MNTEIGLITALFPTGQKQISAKLITLERGMKVHVVSDKNSLN